MCDDINNCCRLCLDVESSHVSIFGDPTISLHMKSCLSLSVSSNDPLPTDICMSCVSQLSQFYHFQLNARCSQDWLESSLQEKSKKSGDSKAPVQPLPDSEYNSDSLLEFLNNTANIEEYLNNLGKEDIPSIVNMLDKNEVIEVCKLTAFKAIKQPSPQKKEKQPMAMEIDVLDSDVEIVKEIIFKGAVLKPDKVENNFHTCYGCKTKLENIQKLCQHVSTCDTASRTCVQCDTLFDSRQKMIEHSTTHSTLSLTCYCKEQFPTKEKLTQHLKSCRNDTTGCTFRCKECGDMSKDRFQLYRHVRNHVMKADEKKCDICGHIFIGNDALANHIKREHKTNNGALYR